MSSVGPRSSNFCLPNVSKVDPTTDDPDLGVKTWCFGRFFCQSCQSYWESSKAWRYYGQGCRKCYEKFERVMFAKAQGLQPLDFYYCDKCEKLWRTRRVRGLKCKSCSTVAKQFDKMEDFKAYCHVENLSRTGSGAIRQEDPHWEVLCEKCQEIGELCYKWKPRMKKWKSRKNTKGFANGSVEVSKK